MLHLKPDQRKSWSYHAEDGFYIAPAKEHYRCIKVFIPKTYRERTTDTATLVPHKINIPQTGIDDHLKQTSEQLVHLLLKKNKPVGPFLQN